jgi:hypothetical protein
MCILVCVCVCVSEELSKPDRQTSGAALAACSDVSVCVCVGGWVDVFEC